MRKALLCVALLASGALTVAQTPVPGSFVKAVEVRVVNVEVMATDRDGNRIGDLMPGDFELFEDGRPQRVSNFYKILDGAAQLDQAQRAAGYTQEDDRFRRRVLLVVDNNFLDLPGRHRALDQVKDFVAERFGGDAEWAVAAIGEELQYLMPFTRERYQVSGALDEIERLPVYSARHALDRNLMNDPIRGQYLYSEERGTGPDLGQELRFSSREQAMRNLRSFGTMAHVLGGLMRSYAGFGGRKAVVMISGKMEFHPEMQYLVSQDSKTGQDRGLTDRVQSDPSLDGARKELEAVLAGLVRAANTAGFQLYTMSAAGLTNPMRLHDVSNRQLGMVKNVGSFAAPPETSDLLTAPQTLADGTGGMALHSNALGDDLAKVISDTGSYYSLGYEPDHAPDRAYHKITVKVKRPGIKIRHREGYLDLTDGERIAEELATPLSYPKPKGNLAVKLEVVELEVVGKNVRLEARASLAVKSLTLLPDDKGGLHGDIDVYLSVYDEKGNNLTVEHQRFPLNVPAGQEADAMSGEVRPTLRFSLPPGAYTMTVTVRDPIVREFGTALTTVLVGEKKG